MYPWTKVFPQIMFPSWGGHISSWIIDPRIQWLPRISRNLEPQWLGGLALVGQIPPGQLRSCTRVCYLMVFWLNSLSVCVWFSVASCETFQIIRRHKGVFFWFWWASLVLSPYLIFWRRILMSNGSACGAKLGAPSRPVPKGPRLNTAWTCPLLLYRLQ